MGLLLPAVAPSASALERRTEETVVVRADETINDDLFASGRSVRIDGRSCRGTSTPSPRT